MEIAKNIRERRLLAELSQAELARRSGITRQALINIENGSADPKSSTLSRLAVALGCSIEMRPDLGPSEDLES